MRSMRICWFNPMDPDLIDDVKSEREDGYVCLSTRGYNMHYFAPDEPAELAREGMPPRSWHRSVLECSGMI